MIFCALLLCLLVGWKETSGQLSNFVATVPNGLYPAPPPGQFHYLYTPVTTTSRLVPTPGAPNSNNSPVINRRRQQQQKKKKPSRRVNMRAVNYTYIPIELLTTLLNNDIRTRPIDPLPLTPNGNNNLQLGSGVFIRVPLRFRNSSSAQQADQGTNIDSPEEVDDEQLEAIADNEVIPMEMFEEMLEMDMRRRFNTTSPVFNSAEGVRVTLNNLLRLFAPPASLLRRAGTNTHQQERLYNRLLRERYQLSSGIFNAHNNNI